MSSPVQARHPGRRPGRPQFTSGRQLRAAVLAGALLLTPGLAAEPPARALPPRHNAASRATRADAAVEGNSAEHGGRAGRPAGLEEFPLRAVSVIAVDPARGAVCIGAAEDWEDGTLLLLADAAAPLAWLRPAARVADPPPRVETGAAVAAAGGDSTVVQAADVRAPEPGRTGGAAALPGNNGRASSPGGADHRMAGRGDWFELATLAALPAQATELRGWIVRPTLVRHLLPNWPDSASLHTRIDAVGPGGLTAWLALGADRGVQFGQSWWLRDAGQPIARLDVRLVLRDAAFCRVLPLVDEPRLEPGLRPELWPTPAEQLRGRAHTAIVHVEQRPSGMFAWAPAPPGCDAPPEAHLDLFRSGRFIGHAVVEQSDERFWFARIMPTLSETEPEIGDLAIVRTRAAIAQRDFDARIFEKSTNGGLLNVGEPERISIGDLATVYRERQAAAQLEITRLKSDFAMAELRDAPAGFDLQVGDVVRWAPPPPEPARLAEVQRVTGGNLLLLSRTTSAPLPLATPLPLRSDGRTIAVVLVLANDAAHSIGFAIKESLPVLPRVGDVLYESEDAL